MDTWSRQNQTQCQSNIFWQTEAGEKVPVLKLAIGRIKDVSRAHFGALTLWSPRPMCHSHQSKRVLDSACPGQYTLENNIAILQFTDFLVLHSPSDKYTKLMKLVHSCLHLWKIEKSSSRLERLLVWYPKAETIVPPKINRKKNFVRLFLVTAKGKCNRPWAEHLVSYFCSEPADNLKCRQVKYEEVLRKKLGFGRHRLRVETRLVAYCRFFPLLYTIRPTHFMCLYIVGRGLEC